MTSICIGTWKSSELLRHGLTLVAHGWTMIDPRTCPCRGCSRVEMRAKLIHDEPSNFGDEQKQVKRSFTVNETTETRKQLNITNQDASTNWKIEISSNSLTKKRVATWNIKFNETSIFKNRSFHCINNFKTKFAIVVGTVETFHSLFKKIIQWWKSIFIAFLVWPTFNWPRYSNSKRGTTGTSSK